MLLFIILVLFFSIPAVQTRLGRYATERLNEDYKTNIKIEKVGLQFNGDVELKQILIRDFKNDTLISATELNTSILNFKNLYNSKLNFGDIDLEDLVLNIITYKGETETNLDVFVARFDDENPRLEKSDFLLSSSDVSVYNGTFNLIDENKETPQILKFTDLGINATNFVINGSDVDARINTLGFVDSRGLVMQNMSTNFKYTLSEMRFDNLNIRTKQSTLKGDLKFNYKREDFKDFEDKVKVTANFTEGDIALNELNTFYNEFGANQHATLSTQLTGTLNDLTANNLKLTTNTRTNVYGTLNFKNLFNAADNNFEMRGEFTKLSSSYYALKDLLPNVLGESIPSIFSKLGTFSITGNTHITSQNIKAKLNINTSLGFVSSDLEISNVDNIDTASYKGNVIFSAFDMGTFLEDPKLGEMSANLDVDGVGFEKENLRSKLTGDVYSINYNNYTYKNILVNGKYQKNIFNGELIADDKNLKLKFNGLADLSKAVNTFDFVANVDYANLKVLNFYNRDETSIFKGIVSMKMQGTTIDDAVGSISFNKTNYKNEVDDYYFNDFAIQSSFQNNERIIEVNSPDIVKGQISGNFKFKNITKLFENSIKDIYTNEAPNVIEENQYIDFNFKIYNKIVEVFFPEVKLGKNTFIKGRVETDEKEFKLTFKSPKIKLLDYFASEIEVQVDNRNPLFNTYIEIDSVNTKYYSASKFNLINVTLNDTLFMRSEFKGGKNNTDNYNLSFYHTINADNKSVVGFKKSDVTFKNNKWYVNNRRDKYNKIEFDRDFKNFKVDRFIMSHQDEEIKLSGIIKDSTYKDIKLDFKDVDLAKITPRIDSLLLAGNVNGKLNVLQQDGNYLPTSKVTIDDLKVNRQLFGSFEANIIGNESLTNYKIDAKIKDDITNSFAAKGDINIAKGNSTINLGLNFNKFSLIPLTPLLDPVLNDIRGDISGEAKVIGNLNKPDINGELLIDSGGLNVPYLNVDYSFEDNSSVSLKNQSFIFNNINITDTKELSKGVLGGSVSHVNFGKWKLDLNIGTDRLLILDTKDNEDALYYGKGFIGGTANIQGPTEALVITADAQTKKGTEFYIPLNDLESFGDNTFIHFLSPEEKLAKAEGKEVIREDITGLELDFNLDVTSDALIEIKMDRESGSTISGRGAGELLFNINTNGKFNMYGDFIVWEGYYNFFFGGIVQKQFVVRPYESNLRWDGDPLKAIIDIKALYSTRTNPSPLLDNPITQNIQTDLEINLTGQLEKPDYDFQFEFPNVNSTLKSELQYRLDSKEDRDKQALNLLATGAFNRQLKDLNVTGTLTERLNGLINGLFSDSEGKLQVGVNIEAGKNTPGFETDSRVGVTLQTKITDRVLINGKVGVPVGGVSESVIAGDVQIDFLLNKEGTLTAKVFNRENSIRNFGEEIGYTQGLGIAYSVDFDTFGELLRKIFKKKDEEVINKKEDPKAKDKDAEKTPFSDSSIGLKKKEN